MPDHTSLSKPGPPFIRLAAASSSVVHLDRAELRIEPVIAGDRGYARSRTYMTNDEVRADLKREEVETFTPR